MNIDDLLRIAMERRASDLHLKVGNYPHLRVDGELVPLTDQARVSAEDMLTMAFSMMSARQKQKFKETTEIDMAYGVAGLGRFRVNVFQQRGNVGLVLRVYLFAMLIYWLTSMVSPGGYAPGVRLLAQVCEPILKPVRRVIPRIGQIDFSILWVSIAIGALLVLLR